MAQKGRSRGLGGVGGRLLKVLHAVVYEVDAVLLWILGGTRAPPALRDALFFLPVALPAVVVAEHMNRFK